jgi:hypothetical protein
MLPYAPQLSYAAIVIVGVGLPAHFKTHVSPCWKFWINPDQNAARHTPASWRADR